jgi:hypothetical protein
MDKSIKIIRLQFEFLMEALELVKLHNVTMSVDKIEAAQALMLELIGQIKQHQKTK